MYRQVRQSLADLFLQGLNKQILPWNQCWNGTRPTNLITGKEYHGINNLFLSYMGTEKGYRSSQWMTYQQAQEHGWSIQEGEKPVRVEFWQYYDKQNREPIEEADVRCIQAEQPQRMKEICLVAHFHALYNAEHIQGAPQPETVTPKVNVSRLAHCGELILHNLGIELREGGKTAYYKPHTDSIYMPYREHFASDYAYVCTLLRAVGHATGHPTRLYRDLNPISGSYGHAKEELRAELALGFTAQALGLKLNNEIGQTSNMDQQIAYIPAWVDMLKKNPNELFAAIRDAEKIASYQLEHGKLMELGRDLEYSREQNHVTPYQAESDEEWDLS